MSAGDVVPGDGRPVEPEEVTTDDLRRVAPFAIGAAIPFIAIVVPPNTHRVPETLVAGALTIAIAVLTWIGVRRNASPRWFSLLALAYLPVVAIVRDSEGGGHSGYGPLVLLPLLWISMFGNRRELLVCVVGIWLVYTTPVWMIGGADYPADIEGRRAAVWVVTSLMVGFSVQELVGRLRDSERRYRTIYEHVREVIFQTDLQGRWVSLNPAWTELTGYPVDTSLGRVAAEFVHPDDRPSDDIDAGNRMREAIQSGRRVEVRFVTSTGAVRWVETNARALVDEHGHVRGTTGTLNDITSRYEAEQMKEQFFALVSHELRTPLAAIVGYLELLEEEEGERLSEDGRNFVAVMQRNSQRLMRLIGDLLFAAQVESGTLSLHRTQVDLAQVVRDACESAQPRAEQGELELTVDVEADPAPMLGDRERLGQVLDNLLTNAIKFTPAGGRVELSLGREGSGDDAEIYAIEVADTGPGIPEAEQAHLFERFRRARAADEQAVQGVGLGLAITRAIVEGHGGQISLRSQLGAGTTFRVELPVGSETAGVAAREEGTSAT